MSWAAASTAVLVLALAGGFGWYERERPPARVLALVAAMAALAVVGRIAFAPFPNVKPTTDIVLFAGYALGSLPGFAVGAVTALVSNLFFGQGPWTAWQMAAWGGVGVAGGLLARAARGREPGRLWLALACGLAGFAFGAVMDAYQWTLGARQGLDSYLAVSATSLPYNVAHAVGNVVFSLAIGPAFLRALRRYRRRFEVSWPAPAPAAVAAIVAALAVTITLAAPAAPAQASVGGRAAAWLARAQNRDGGFGAARGASSNQLFTGWSALGLAAARRNPRDVHRRGGRSLTRYLARGAGGLTDVGDLERTILVLKAAGLSPRRFAGRNLLAELLRHRRPNGTFDSTVNHTAFGILALRAAGRPVSSVAAGADYLERAQNGDGGFGFSAHAGSDSDDTGAALQALAAAGRRSGTAARRAVGYLRGTQNHDGGWGQSEGRESNAQSTAFAVQGLLAVRVRPEGVGANPIRYLVRLQRRDGHIAYSRTSDQTPVWVTAQALTALRRRTFPLATVPRAHRRRHRARRSAAKIAAVPPTARGHRSPRPVTKTAPGTASDGSPAVVPPAEVARRLLRRSAHAKDDDGGVPPLAIAAAALAALLAVAGLRHRLRRRRSPQPARPAPTQDVP